MCVGTTQVELLIIMSKLLKQQRYTLRYGNHISNCSQDIDYLIDVSAVVFCGFPRKLRHSALNSMTIVAFNILCNSFLSIIPSLDATQNEL
jgi:hypothetical protein